MAVLCWAVTSLNSVYLVPLLQVVSISGQPYQAYYKFPEPNRNWPAELRCRGTVTVAQSSCCTMKTRDDSAHFQETTEGLSVAHLMCWQTQGTFTTAWRCCDVSVNLAPDFLTYLGWTMFLLGELSHMDDIKNQTRSQHLLVHCFHH